MKIYLLINIFTWNKLKMNNFNFNEIIIKKEFQKLILILLLCFLNDINDKNKSYKFNKSFYDKEVNLININYTIEQYKIKGLNYLNNIKKSKINNITKQINNPKISIIIPIYNCQNTIELTFKSIHFQTLKEIEIVLVNDLSFDNSSHIIEKLKYFDKRINIINNKRNMGTLYSRCIGCLKAKGEYLICLDNDDLFLFEEILNTLYINAKKNYFDIVESKSFVIHNYNPKYEDISIGAFNSHPDNLILHQPELGKFPLSMNNKIALTDHYIWGKCIRAIIYKKAINALGKKRYSIYNCWTEDMTMVLVLFNIANSFIFLKLFGIFHFRGKETTTNRLTNNHKLLSDIFFFGVFFDFTKNDYIEKNYVAEYALKFSINNIIYLDNNQKNLFLSIINKVN